MGSHLGQGQLSGRSLQPSAWLTAVGPQVALVLRSTLDLSDRLASKATSDPVVESMLQEHPDPFDSYRTENEEERDVFTILPPLGMNLGLGGSKRGSVIDLDKEAERERERTKEDTSTTLTPRQGSRKAPISVSEVLGINSGTATDSGGDDDTEPDSADEQLETTPRHRRRSHPPPPPHDNPFASSSTSPVATSLNGDSPLATTSTVTDAPDSPSPTRIAAAGLSVKAQTPTPTKKRQKAGSRRELSRVAEMEADPMAGEWGVPEYGKSLSPDMGGYGSDVSCSVVHSSDSRADLTLSVSLALSLPLSLSRMSLSCCLTSWQCCLLDLSILFRRCRSSTGLRAQGRRTRRSFLGV